MGRSVTISTQFGTLSVKLHTPSSAQRQHVHLGTGRNIPGIIKVLKLLFNTLNYATSRHNAKHKARSFLPLPLMLLLDEAALRQTNGAHPTRGRCPFLSLSQGECWREIGLGRKKTPLESPQSAGLGVSSCISCDVGVVFAYWVLPMHLSLGSFFMSQFFSKNIQIHLQKPSLFCSRFSYNILKYRVKRYLQIAISVPFF